MPVLEAALVSLAFSVAGDVWNTVAGGIAGNAAHDGLKVVFRKLVERVNSRTLPFSHEVVRACRRSQLLATHYAANHFAAHGAQPTSNNLASWEQAWAKRLARHCWEEVQWTRNEDYVAPPSALSDHADALVAVVFGSDQPGATLQECVIGELLAELEEWHTNDWARHQTHSEPYPPKSFVEYLQTTNWPHVEPSRSVVRSALRFLTQRHGANASQVRASQEVRAAVRAGAVGWFAAFAAYFAAEMKTDPNIQYLVNAELLASIGDRLGEDNSQQTAGPGRAFADSLERWGGTLCSDLCQLLRTVQDSHGEVVERLVRLATLSERDQEVGQAILERLQAVHPKLDDLSADIGYTRQQLSGVLEGVANVRARLDIPSHKPPLQLPPEATVGELIGRDKERVALGRLLAEHRTCAVVGPAGFGKTALAAAAVRDIVGRDHASLSSSPFPDGVIFINLYRLQGRADEIFTTLAEAFLGAAHEDRAPLARARLACASRRALIVLEGAELADDRSGRCSLARVREVWEPQCVSLVLTRDITQADPARRVELTKPLDDADATRLLERRTQGRFASRRLLPVLELAQGHPLALDWAGGLLIRGDDNPEALVRDWQQAPLTLTDPEVPHHNLRWLFERSRNGLGPDATVTLDVAGLLANEVFAARAISAVLGSYDRTRKGLRELVRSSFLRLQNDIEAHYEFTHVLGYSFSRQAAAWTPETVTGLGHWLYEELALAIADGTNNVTTLGSLLRHTDSLLCGDRKQQLWDPLITWLLHSAVPALTTRGRLGLAHLALRSIEDWLKRLPPKVARRGYWQSKVACIAFSRGLLMEQAERLSEALAAFRSSCSIYRDLATTEPSSALFQIGLALGLDGVGRIQNAYKEYDAAEVAFSEALRARLTYVHPSNTAWKEDLEARKERVVDATMEASDVAQAIYRQLVDSNSCSTGWQADFALSVSNLGRVRLAKHTPDGAAPFFNAARLIFKQLAESYPNDRRWQWNLAGSLGDLGRVGQAKQDFSEAEVWFEAARDIFRLLADSDPSDPLLQRQLALSLGDLANTRLSKNDLSGADECFASARDIFRKLVNLNPSDPQWQYQLSFCTYNLGRVSQAGYKIARAAEYFEDARDILQRVTDVELDVPGWRRQLAVNLGSLGFVRLFHGSLEQAAEASEAASNISKQLTNADPNNPGWQRELAFSLSGLGSVRLAKADLDGAIVCFEAARNIFQQLAERDSDDPQWTYQVAFCLKSLGQVWQAKRDFAAAGRWFDAAYDLVVRLVDSQHSSSDWWRTCANALDDLGTLYRNSGHLESAARTFEGARTVLQKLVNSNPANPQSLCDLSASLNHLGALYESLNDLESAAEAFDASREIAEKLVDFDSAGVAFLQNLANQWESVGRVQQAVGDIERSAEAFGAARDIFQQLNSSEPDNPLWRRRLAIALDNLGALHHVAGDLYTAIAMFDRARAIFQLLTDLNPSNTECLHDLLVALDHLGRAYEAREIFESAADAFGASRDIAQRLVDVEPSNSEANHSLALRLDNVGRVQQALGQLDRSTEAFTAARDIFHQLNSSEPDNPLWQRHLAIALDSLGALHYAKGDVDTATSIFEDARTIYQRLVDLEPSSPTCLRDLGNALDNLGAVYEAQEAFESAAGAFDASRNVACQLVELDPSSTGAKHNLALHWDNVGRVQEALDKIDKAVEAFSAAREIFHQLNSSEPDNPLWQHHIALELCYLGSLGDVDTAVAMFQAARSRLEELTRSHPLNDDYQRHMAIVSDALAALSEPERTRG
jgi:tetratricopeptide (TPR) repeat protein